MTSYTIKDDLQEGPTASQYLGPMAHQQGTPSSVLQRQKKLIRKKKFLQL